VRGLSLAWFWLDEAPLCGYYAWQVLKGRLRQKGFTTAGWATGTPHGRDGFWRDFEQRPRPRHALFRAATDANAANLPPDYIAQLGYTGALYDQEVLGRFTAFAGLVYAFDASRQGHLRTPAPGLAGRRSSAAWTGATPIQRPRWCSAWMVTVAPGSWTSSISAAPRLEEVLLPALLELTRRYGVQRWYCGPDEPEHIAALAAGLARERLPAVALRADNAVSAGIQTVTRLLSLRGDGTRGLYIHPRCTHTIAEYGSYQYAQERSAASGASVTAGKEPSETATQAKRPRARRHTLRPAHASAPGARAADAYLAAMQRRLGGQGMAGEG